MPEDPSSYISLGELESPSQKETPPAEKPAPTVQSAPAPAARLEETAYRNPPSKKSLVKYDSRCDMKRMEHLIKTADDEFDFLGSLIMTNRDRFPMLSRDYERDVYIRELLWLLAFRMSLPRK